MNTQPTVTQRAEALAALLARREFVAALYVKHGVSEGGKDECPMAWEAFYTELAAYDDAKDKAKDKAVAEAAASPAAQHCPAKEAFQRRMINAIERGDNFGLEGWTTHELHDLEFAAELWKAPTACRAILRELANRGA